MRSKRCTVQNQRITLKSLDIIHPRRPRGKDSGSKGKTTLAEKKKKKNGAKKSKQTFCLLIGVRKLLCFSAQSEGSRPWNRFLCSYTKKYMMSSCSKRLYARGERLNIRTKCKDICDYLTGKNAGPFAGIITVAYLKVCQIFIDFSAVKEL